MTGILDGIRVLDFGRYIAGPYCATLMGDLGADVIRVERLDGGEDRYVTPVTDDGMGAMYLQLARNKRSLTLNPRKPEGAEIVRKLVGSTDVVVANLTPEALASLGLDYESLRAVKKDIILVTNSAFGQGGPWSHRYGFDGLAQAMSGIMYMSGSPGQPTRASAAVIDFNTAALCAFGAMAALRHRDLTGEGQEVQGALLRSALNIMGATIMEQDVLQVNREATLNRGQTSAPSDTVKTKDGWVMCLVIGPHQFKRWCEAVGREDLLEDSGFDSDLKRGDRSEELSAIMSEWAAERTTEEVLAIMEQAQVPAGPVLSPQQALEHPHVQGIGFFERVDYPTAKGPLPIARTPVVFTKSPGEIRERAPQLGEHTEEILGELGYDAGPDRGASLRSRRLRALGRDLAVAKASASACRSVVVAVSARYGGPLTSRHGATEPGQRAGDRGDALRPAGAAATALRLRHPDRRAVRRQSARAPGDPGGRHSARLPCRPARRLRLSAGDSGGGGRVVGRVLIDVRPSDYERLDAYEGVGEDLYQRQVARALIGAGDEREVYVYTATDKTLDRYA